MSDVEKSCAAGVAGSAAMAAAVSGGGDKEKSKFVRDISRVIITLENIIIPDESLSPTPSELDGLTRDTEMDLRILGCELIQTAGILLKLPQVAMATGQVLFQRFYYSKSFVKHTMEILAMACINLASKVEEAPRRIRDVVNVFHHIKQFKQKKTISPLILDQNYVNLKNQVIKSERRVLKELGFCVHVKHPHKIIVMYLQVLEAERNQRLLQCAWNYMNDSFRTNAFVRFNPETIASACIYLAARQLQIPLPNNPHWFLVFGINEHDIRQVCMAILRLYTRSKPNADELEKIVGEIKKQHIENKMKAKELAMLGASSNHGSTVATPENSTHSPSVAAKKKTDTEKFEYDRSRKDSSQVTGRKRSRSRSRSLSLVKKLKSDDSEKSRSYNSSSRSRSRSPRPKIQPSQQHGHASKKDDYYARQKGGSKRVEKYSGSDGTEWKKHKSLNSIRPELIVDLTAKYSKENKKDRHYKLDLKQDDRYNKKRSSKYARDEISPPPVRGYSSSPERLMKKKNKHKNKIVSKSPTDRMESSKERNGQIRLGRSNHHGRRVHRR